MDYERLINRFTNRRDYFKKLDFLQHAEDLDKAIEAIRTLLEEKKFLENNLKDENKDEKSKG